MPQTQVAPAILNYALGIPGTFLPHSSIHAFNLYTAFLPIKGCNAGHMVRGALWKEKCCSSSTSCKSVTEQLFSWVFPGKVDPGGRVTHTEDDEAKIASTKESHIIGEDPPKPFET